MILSFGVFLTLSILPFDEGIEKPKVVEWAVTKAYAPKGFDSNDVAQFIIEGEFPSTCYRVGDVRFVDSGDDNKFVFRLLAYEYKGPCLQQVTPFIQAVDLKVLEPGQYSIWNSKVKDRALALLNIRKTESTMRDDFSYAAVDSAVVIWSEENQRSYLMLFGNLTNSCQKFDRERFWMRETSPGLIEVLPILTKEERSDCRDGRIQFREKFWIPEYIPSGQYVFHIRTMNGTSFNKTDYVRNNVQSR